MTKAQEIMEKHIIDTLSHKQLFFSEIKELLDRVPLENVSLLKIIEILVDKSWYLTAAYLAKEYDL